MNAHLSQLSIVQRGYLMHLIVCSFEKAMLAASKCDVFTFDCSFDGKSIDPR